VLRLKSEPGETIFIDGGAQIASALLKEQLIDEIILSVIPVLLGEGIRLFTDGRPGQNLTLISAKNFDSGLVQLHYRCT
jgi:dihydrofolate reductase